MEEVVCLGPACSVWVLHAEERFYNMSLGDFESVFIKAGTLSPG